MLATKNQKDTSSTLASATARVASVDYANPKDHNQICHVVDMVDGRRLFLKAKSAQGVYFGVHAYTGNLQEGAYLVEITETHTGENIYSFE